MINFPAKPEPGQYYIESDCGKYRIAVFEVWGKRKYRLFKRGKGSWPPLGTFNSAAEARESLK